MMRALPVRRAGATWAATVAFTAVAAGVGLTPVAQPAAAATTATAQLSWSDCRDGFQCATAWVPLDYDRPDGAKVSLSLIRLPAGNPRQRIGSLFINPGGPGGSGVDIVRGLARSLPLQLRGRFDIVGFDPRGILRSTPVRCFPTFSDVVAVLPPFPYPETPKQENTQQALDKKLASACARHGGPILAHMSTADVARDMDRLRQAVGDRKLNYLGFSYGSFLGQTYANLFPNRVRAVVIDGVLDPIAWTTGRGSESRTTPVFSRIRADEGAQRTLGEFFRLCDAARTECAFAGRSQQRFAALAKRLRQHPIVVEGGDPSSAFTYETLIAVTLASLYWPAVWPDLADFLTSVNTSLNQTAAPTELARDLARLRVGLGLGTQQQEPYPNVVEGLPGVACSDSTNPTSHTAWARAADVAEQRYGYFGRLWTWQSSPCAVWPKQAGQDRYQGPWTARTASPVLVVGNRFDPATAYRGAVSAARLLPNSRLLTYAGWGHTAFFSAGNYCVDSTVTRYLVNAKAPVAGKVCRPAGSPFGPTEAAVGALKGSFPLGNAVLPYGTRRALAGR